MIIRGGVIPSDLATIQMESGQKMYMAVLSSWGYVADIDIESEKFRSIGEVRFILGALKAILQKRTYQGRLHYLPMEEEDEGMKEERRDDGLEGGESEGQQQVGEGSAGMMQQEDPRNRSGDRYQENAASRQLQNEESAQNQQQQLELATDLLPPSLSDPVPSNWKTIEGNFVGVMVLLAPFVAHGFAGDLNLILGSGKMHISYSLDDITRGGLLAMLLSADTASYLQREDVHVVKTRAYRLEPLTPGILTIDGEAVDYIPHQVQLHPQLVRIMSRRRRNWNHK